MTETSERWSVTRVAQIAGVTPRTVRYYHSIGVLPEPPRDASGYRRYGSKEVIEVVRAARLRALGMSLPQIAQQVQSLESDDAPLADALGALADELDAEIDRLTRTRDRLREMAGSETYDQPAQALTEALQDRGVLGPADRLRSGEKMAAAVLDALHPEGMTGVLDRASRLLGDSGDAGRARPPAAAARHAQQEEHRRRDRGPGRRRRRGAAVRRRRGQVRHRPGRPAADRPAQSDPAALHARAAHPPGERPMTYSEAPAPGLQRAGARLPLPEYARRLYHRRYFVAAYSSASNAVGYEGSFLGQAWQLLTPLLNIAVYYLIFGLLLKTNRGVSNYIAFLSVGVFFFAFCTDSLTVGRDVRSAATSAWCAPCSSPARCCRCRRRWWRCCGCSTR